MDVQLIQRLLSNRGVKVVFNQNLGANAVDLSYPQIIRFVFDYPELWNLEKKDQLRGLLTSEGFALDGYLGVSNTSYDYLECLYLPDSWLLTTMQFGRDVKYVLQKNLHFLGDYSENKDEIKNSYLFLQQDVKILNGLNNVTKFIEELDKIQASLSIQEKYLLPESFYSFFKSSYNYLKDFKELMELLKENTPEYSGSKVKEYGEEFLNRWYIIEQFTQR